MAEDNPKSDAEPITAHVIGEERDSTHGFLGMRRAERPEKKRAKERQKTAKAADSLAQSRGEGYGGITNVVALGFNVPDVIHPPYDPSELNLIFENSNSLRQNVDGYATNIEGFGFHFEPVINLEADDAREKVSDAMFLDRLLESEGGDPIDVEEPSEEEIDDKISELRRLMAIERAKLESFFNYCSVDISFVTLSRRRRVDLETTGNAYWEVIRDGAGYPHQLVFMPSHTVRLVKREGKRVEVEQQVQKGPITFVQQKVKRSFRRYVQSADATLPPVWFKEFGDPRVMSSRSGRYYENASAMLMQEKDAEEANEVIHFVVHSTSSSYGVPRWIGNLLSVLGSRDCEEVNFSYFRNKTIPPLVITVSGGRMNSESVERIRSFLKNEIKGKHNFHNVLILEAESSGMAASLGMENAGKCRIEIKPLTEAHLKDALFQQYDERNIDKVGMSFRLPRMLRGDIRDFNRASAQAALEFAESQVFGPERLETDFTINRMILPELEIKYWKFVSDGPRITDAAEMAGIVTSMATAGILTPKDARAIASDRVFYRDLPKIDADWMEQPIALTVAGFGLDTVDDDMIPMPAGGVAAGGEAPALPKPGGNSAGGMESSTAGLGSAVAAGKSEKVRKQALRRYALKLQALRDTLAEMEAQEAAQALAKSKADTEVSKRVDLDEEPTVIKMSADEFKERFNVEVGKKKDRVA